MMLRVLILLSLLAAPALADGKESALALNEQGIAAVKRGDYDEAVRLFTEARKYLPADETLRMNLAAAHARRGLVAAKEGKEEEARKDFRFAVHYDPDRPSYRVNFALSLVEAKDLAGARKQLEVVLLREPKHPEALEHYGRILYRENDLAGAIRAWKTALEVRPDRDIVRKALTKALREQKVESGMRRDAGAHFAVTFDGERNERVAREILELLEDAYQTIGFELGHYPTERVQVILYTKEQFRAATEAKSWVGGLYDGKIRLPVRGRSGAEAGLRRTVVHEYVHVVVRDLAPRCPVWINEGMAQLLEGKSVTASDRIVLAADRLGRLLTVKKLARPFVTIRDPEEAGLAYAQAHSFTAYLTRSSGGPSFTEFLRAMKRGETPAKAFEHAYRNTIEQAWGHWLDDLPETRPRPAAIAVSRVGRPIPAVTFGRSRASLFTEAIRRTREPRRDRRRAARPGLGRPARRRPGPLSRGPAALRLDRLLGLLLRGGEPASRGLLDRHGSLRALVARSAEELSREPGVGPDGAARLRAAFEIAARVAEERLPRGMRLPSSRVVYEAYHARLRDRRKEVFLALLLDGKHRLIREERVSEGTLTASLVHPREVYTAAIREGAAAVILVHNHPSGDPAPSPEDVEITARLVEVGRLVGIRLLDHVILGDGCFASCFERGIVDGT